jgi:hypothetical protein
MHFYMAYAKWNYIYSFNIYKIDPGESVNVVLCYTYNMRNACNLKASQIYGEDTSCICPLVFVKKLKITNRMNYSYLWQVQKEFRKIPSGLLDVRGYVHHSIFHIENPTICNSVSKFYFIFIWAQHVSDDIPPIIRSLKLY